MAVIAGLLKAPSTTLTAPRLDPGDNAVTADAFLPNVKAKGISPLRRKYDQARNLNYRPGNYRARKSPFSPYLYLEMVRQEM